MSDKKGTLAGFQDLSTEELVTTLMEEHNDKGGSKANPPAPKEPATPPAAKATETPAEPPKAPESKKKDPLDIPPADKKKGDDTPPPAPETPPADADKNKKELEAAQKTYDDAVKAAKTPEEKEAAKKIFDESKTKLTGEAEKPFEPEFVLPGEEKAKEGAAAEEGDGWKTLAKDMFELDIAEDKPEVFKAKLDEYYAKKYETNLGKYNAETQLFIQALEGGMTVQEYLEPLKQIHELKALTNVELMEQELKMRKWDDKLIEKEITRLVKDDLIDVEAQKVREALDRVEQSTSQKILNAKAEAQKRTDTYKQQSAASELKAIKESLNTVSDFMETPLKAKHKDYITQKYEAGAYKDAFNDPKVRAEFLLYLEFGKAGVENLKNKTMEAAKLTYKNDRHNIPPVPLEGGAQPAGGADTKKNNGGKAEGNWAALDGFKTAVFGQENE